MNFEKRYRNSRFFFSISLLFLVVFLGVWLQNVYQDKVAELETEVSFLWIKSVKDVERLNTLKLLLATTAGAIESSIDSLKNKAEITSIIRLSLGESVPEEIYDLGKKFQTHTNQNTLNDTTINNNLEVLILQEYDSLEHIPDQDSFLGTQIPDHFKTFPKLRMSSSVSEEISKNQLHLLDKLSLDTTFVKSKLDKELLLAQLPIRYTINLVKDSVYASSYLNDRFITQVTNGKRYSLELGYAISFVLQRMWFEFLMGLLLLSVITATFHYILNNLKEQNRLVAIKNDLISNITHELRTPIFTVSAALEALESFNGLENPERTKEYLSISKNELNRLSILVEKVLHTSLFEQGVLKINCEVFPILPLLQSISNSLQLQLNQENATLEILPSDTNIQVRADKIHLTNVVFNLIDNALKYKANRPTKIRIEVLNTTTQTQIVVSDNGIGIPKIYLDQIFNKFFRVPQGNQHNVKGYGLGLNYVSNILQQHQGSVTIQSKDGKGSQFTISLPKYSTR